MKYWQHCDCFRCLPLLVNCNLINETKFLEFSFICFSSDFFLYFLFVSFVFYFKCLFIPVFFWKKLECIVSIIFFWQIANSFFSNFILIHFNQYFNTWYFSISMLDITCMINYSSSKISDLISNINTTILNILNWRSYR